MNNKKVFSRFLAVVMVLIMALGLVPSVYAAEPDTETLDGWSLGEGYSVNSQWVYEGSYSLKHEGAQSEAKTDAITLKDGTDYFVTVYVKAVDDAEVTVDFAGQKLVSEGTGTWEKLLVNVQGKGVAEVMTVTAKGEAYIDGISVRPFEKGEELLSVGTFDTTGWGGFTWVNEWEGKQGVITSSGSGVVRADSSVSVEQDSWYIFSADIYLTAAENPVWAYIDMDDTANEIQLRGTLSGEWQTVVGIWNSGTKTSTPIRFVKESNWDNPTSSPGANGAVYVDNVSFRQVTVYEDSIIDESFEDYYAGAEAVEYEWVTVNADNPNVTADSTTVRSNSENCTAPHNYYGGDSMQVGEWAEFKFTGTQFTIAAGHSADSAGFEVYIDGATTPAGSVDLCAAEWHVKDCFTSEELENKEHTVRIVPITKGEPGMGNHTRKYCGIDAFTYKKVTAVPTEWVTVNTTDSSVTCDGSTNKSSYENPNREGCPYYIGDDSMNIQQWAEFKFTGIRFSIIGSCSLDCAAFDVYIDGATTPTARVDLAKDPWQTAEVFVSDKLENKEHTVRLVPALRGETVTFPKGTYTRNYCGIDAFKYEKVVTEGEDKPVNITWKLNDGASIQKDTYVLYGKQSLKLENTSSAIANNGKTITVEPNTYYYLTAMAFRPGNKDISGKITINDANTGEELYFLNPTRYNQTMWNPANGSNLAEKQVGHWEQVGGMWYSGDNTEITVAVETQGTGVYYFDQVALNGYEDRAPGKSIFENGDMEGYIPDAIDLLPTKQEKERVKEQYESFLEDNLKNFPTSFKIDGKAYYGFGEDFTLTSQTTENVNREVAGGKVGEKTITKLTHTSGLVFTVESVLYEEYNAYDWTLYAAQPENATGNSPVISDWNAIDYNWEGETPRLNGTIGDHAAYEPYINYVNGKVYKTNGSGRGTSGDSSYFNFQYGDKGIMMAVGWPGYWELELDNSENAQSTRMTAGQVELNTYLKPGEEIRTPLMAFVHYNGRNEDRSTNLWRSWMIDCNVNTITPDAEGNEPEELPAAGIYAATSIQWHEMTRATTENQKTAIKYYLDNDIDLTYWWMDAGWYYKLDSQGNFQTLDDWGWTATGTWVADADRFGCDHDGEQHGPLYDISAYAEENGIRTLLWFEPERIANRSMLVDDATDRVHYSDNTTIHPSWILDSSSGASPIMDMGNEDAVSWMLNRILTVMKEGGIDMYREDFNTDPLTNWQTSDRAKDSSGNRKGITENLYIQGHLGMWDSILEAIPNATIDSCASGGNRNDLESMRRGVPLHKTDHAYGDQTWQQNSAAYFQKWVPYLGTKANGESEANDNTKTANRYALRTALVGGMVLGYDTDSKNAPVDWDIIEDITEEHKDIMHLLYSDYYVHEDWSSSGDSWSAWQYFDQDLGEGYLIAFRRENASATRTYYLKGLDKTTEYKIWFEDANKPVVRTGLDLMKNGVEFTVPVQMGSDILHIQKADEADENRALTSIISEVSSNGQYKGAVVQSGDYTRFDIHFNMNLRDTVLESGTLEKNVEDDYKDLITVDGDKVSELLAEDSEAVYMDYDAFNNILNVYVKNAMFDKDEDHEVVLSKDIETDGEAVIEGSTTWKYSGSKGEWEKSSVSDGLVKAIEIVGDDNMLVGETQTLTVKVSPATAENKKVEWSSSDTSVATVDANGVVTALKAGTVTITAVTTDGTRLSAEIEITVDPVLAQAITVSGDEEMENGTEQTLLATVTPDNTTNPEVEWSSSDTSVATVDANGKITALKVGSVTVTATATDGSGVSGSITIEVTPILAQSVTISGEDEMVIGDEQTLAAVVEPADTANPELEWTSSDTSVATVDQAGKVTALKDGNVVITASVKDGSNVSDVFAITVKPIAVEEITVSGEGEMEVGETQNLTVEVDPEDVTYPEVEWSSSDEDVATVDENGVVTAVGEGEVTITATNVKDDTVFGEIEITVTKKQAPPSEDNKEDGKEETKPETKPENDKVANTGDTFSIVICIAVVVAAAGAAVVLILLKKRTSHNE